MSELDEIEIDRAKFAAWLETEPETTSMEWGNCKTCPIAMYLSSLGLKHVYVSNDVIVHGPPGSFSPAQYLPFWARRFIGLYDGRRGRMPSEARAILQDVPQ